MPNNLGVSRVGYPTGSAWASWAIMRSLWATISPVVNESATTDDYTRF